MANRKITVVGDGAEEFLTPEEEHKIEVKIDKMLDLNQPDEPAEAPASPLPPEPKTAEVAPKPKSNVTKIITKFADEPDEQKPEQVAQSAPPLQKKAAKKITVTEHKKKIEPPKEDESVADVPKKLEPKVTRIITKFADEPTDEVTEPESTAGKQASSDLDAIQAAALAAEAHLENSKAAAGQAAVQTVADESTGVEISDEATEDTVETTPVVPSTPKKIITKFADEPGDPLAETVAETTPTTPELPASDEPPTGPKIPPQAEAPQPAKPDPLPGLRPIAFPRATPPKPIASQEVVDDLASTRTDSLSAEDAAIAHAFETKPKTRGQGISNVAAAIFNVKTLRILIILVILAAIATPLAIPKVRGKLTHFVRTVHSSTPAPKPANPKSVAVQPVLATAKEIFVAKQNGTYNVYKTDANGQNQQLLLAGTGNEASDGMVLTTNPANTAAALVSVRTKPALSSQSSPQTLTVLNIASGKADITDQADQIKIIDWFGSRVVYALVKTSLSAADTNRYQLISYDTKTKQRTVLDHVSYINDVLSARGFVYYATSSQFIKISASGASKQVLLSHEVWRIYRTDYNNLALATATTWYTYKLGDTAPPAATNSPYIGKSRLYIDSNDGKHSLWINSSSGKNVLVSYDTTTGKDSVLSTQDNPIYPVRWLSSGTVSYRIKSSSETADYSIATTGGTPKKITDIIPTAGIALWFNE